MGQIKRRRHLTTFQIIIIGFLLVIIAGAILLMLPIATQGKGGASFIEALFTSTSAVCVTGLVVQDTATYWSDFGHFIILFLIQIGGMGVVTISVAISVISGRKIGLMQRSTMMEAIGAPQVGGIVRLTNFIIKMTFIFELSGMFIMYPVFCRDFGPIKGLWYACFHSISAFCNAGFDLMGVKEHYSSLTLYANSPTITFTISLLIIIGGIGFFTWNDIKMNKLNYKKYRLQTKIILCTTLILIIFPTIYFYFIELSKGEWAQTSVGHKFLYAFFQAVTPRTAGFNTIDLSKMTEGGRMIIILLMLIGGSPGSTAGGMKTTTIAVLFASTIAVFKRDAEAHYFKRSIHSNTIRYAAAILLMYITLSFGGAIIISEVEGLPILTSLFETASAVGTVGLSLGVTPTLGLISRVILIILMYCGRVGGLTLVYAAISAEKVFISKLPPEKITVG